MRQELYCHQRRSNRKHYHDINKTRLPSLDVLDVRRATREEGTADFDLALRKMRCVR